MKTTGDFENEITRESQRKESKNVSQMVILTCFIFVIGNSLNPLLFFAKIILHFSEDLLAVLSLVSNTLLFSSVGVNIFVYYSFNCNYRMIVKTEFLNKTRIIFLSN